ncbi:MAG: hypothetical protein WC373_09675 [Smithella sp.]|jgi:hypothetical protein
MKKVMIILFAVLFIGCATMNYQGAKIESEPKQTLLDATKSEILSATKKIFALEGFQISTIDEEAGIISTASKLIDLTENDCDCGSTFGLPYIRDKRTRTWLSLNAVIENGSLILKTNIKGEYLENDLVQGVEMECVSTGNYERKMIERIKTLLNK